MNSVIARKEIPATPMIRETAYSQRELGSHSSTMELHCHNNHYMIEWDIPDLEETEHIGLWFTGKTLEDYDGVYSLPAEAIALIREAGFIVPEEYEN